MIWVTQQAAQTKKDLLMKRAQVLRCLRKFFEERDFLELSTPLLVKNPGLEPYLRIFKTRFEPDMGGGKAENFYLPTSPEYHLKKALGRWGFERVFEVSRSFRNGERSSLHEPEFSMLEWYRSPGSYQEIAQDFEELMKVLGKTFAPQDAWDKVRHLTVNEAYQKYAGVDLEGALSGKAKSLAEQAGEASEDFETCFHRLMVSKVEPKLGQQGPEFLWDYPATLSALARLKPGTSLWCERFEVYWKGIELANAFGELIDPQEQRRRCEADRLKRLELYGESPDIDDEFLTCLGQIKHPSGGIAVGLDRFIQCLLGAKNVQDVVAFPHAI